MRYLNLVTDNDARPDAEKLAGQRLRALRTDPARGWSQRQVAEAMRAYGYSWHQTVVAKIEQGTRPIRLNEALDLAALFRVSLTDLLVPPTGPESLEGLRQDAKALHEALAQEAEKAERAQKEIARATDEYTLARMALENIQSKLRLLDELEKGALGDEP
jgi:transcriptional regulator with XRE-family HTH domain